MRSLWLSSLVAACCGFLAGLAFSFIFIRQGDNVPAPEITEAIRQLAPDGGSGLKNYYYSSGALKQQDHWENYNVVQTDYYHPTGRLLYTAHLQDGGGLLMSLNENGTITEIFETKHYVIEGARFIFNNGCLSRIVRVYNEDTVSDVPLDSSTQVDQ
jgi:hypothetical protein